MERIGEICKNLEERIIEWKVKDFFSLSDAIDTRYESPNFRFFGISWNIRLCPNGEKSNESDGYISLYLMRRSSGSSVTLDYALALKSTHMNRNHIKQTTSDFDEVNSGIGYAKFIRRSEFMERKADLAPSDEMTIICTLKNNAPVILFPTATTEDKCAQTESHLNIDVSMTSLFKDFSELLDSGPNHDAEIKCGDFSMKAHKIILGARSEVFKAMLQSDMLEGRTGVVEIQDMDPNFIQDFIKYLYTGTIPELTFDKAKALYEAGDKYAIRSLVFRCSKYLQNNLSPEIACQCLLLADAHSDVELRSKVTTHMLDEKLYLKDELWLPFCEKYPKLANEVYRLSYKATQNKNE